MSAYELLAKKREVIVEQLRQTVAAVEQMKGALSVIDQLAEELQAQEQPEEQPGKLNGTIPS